MGAARVTLITLNVTQLATGAKKSMLPKKERLPHRPLGVRLRSRHTKALPIGPRARTTLSVSPDKCGKGEHGHTGTTEGLSTGSGLAKPLPSLEPDSKVSSPGRNRRLGETLTVTTASENETPGKAVVVDRCGKKDGDRSISSTPELSSVGSVSFKSMVSLDAANAASARRSYSASKSSAAGITPVDESRDGCPAVASDDDLACRSARSDLLSKGSFSVQSQEADTFDAHSPRMASPPCRIETEIIDASASPVPAPVTNESMPDVERLDNTRGEVDVSARSVSIEEIESHLGNLEIPIHEDPATTDGINCSPGSMEYPDLCQTLATSTADENTSDPAASRNRKYEVVKITRRKTSRSKSSAANSSSTHSFPVESLRELEVFRSNRSQSPGMTHSRFRKKLVVAPRKTRLWADMSVRAECGTGGERAVSIKGCLLNTSPGPCKKDRMYLRDYAIVGIPVSATRKLLDASRQAVGTPAVTFSRFKIIRKDSRHMWLRVDINDSALLQGEIRADLRQEAASRRRRRPSFPRLDVAHYDRLRLIGMGLKETPCVLVLTPSASVLVDSGVSFGEAKKGKKKWKLEFGLAACHILA